MDIGAARDLLSAHVKETFGRVVELREVSVVRTATGRVFRGSLFCLTRRGEVEVGSLGVNEAGKIMGTFGVEELLDVLMRLRPSAVPGAAYSIADESWLETAAQTAEPAKEAFEELTVDDSGITSGFFNEGSGGAGRMVAEISDEELPAKVTQLLRSGDASDLREARVLLPRLLQLPDQRGLVLRQMGELEFHLGEVDLGLNYFEAAAREFTDRADVDNLDRVAELVLQAIGPEAFAGHPIKQLMSHLRLQLRPVDRLVQAPVFAGLEQAVIFELEGLAESLKVRAGEEILREGTPAVRAFVIRSGIASVRLQTPDGGDKFVRCCFPGEFIGESSVIGGTGATCSATVRADRLSALWSFEGYKLAQLTRRLPLLRARIESARAIHRLDSFLSTHEKTSFLDTRIRDRLLGCIVAVKHVVAGEVLGADGEKPQFVFLVAQGRVAQGPSGAAPRVHEADSFLALRDCLHDLPLEGDLTAMEPSRLVVFDAAALKELAAKAPPEVVAALERLD